MTPEKRERIRLNMLEELKIKEGEDFIEGMSELHVWSFNVSTEKKEKKKKKKKKKKTKEEIEAEKQPTGNILEESQEVDLNELAKRDQKALAERQKLFRNIECEKSCYLLSKVKIFVLNLFLYRKIYSEFYATKSYITVNSKHSSCF
jgi:hypothetical protein